MTRNYSTRNLLSRNKKYQTFITETEKDSEAMNKSKENIRVQQWVVAVACTLFTLKIIAYYLTQSVAILTDALESTVNVIAGAIGLYSLWVGAKPRDVDHPYGHGKASSYRLPSKGSHLLLPTSAHITAALSIAPRSARSHAYAIDHTTVLHPAHPD